MDEVYKLFFSLIELGPYSKQSITISVFFENYKKNKFFWKSVKKSLEDIGFKTISSLNNFFAVSHTKNCRINCITVMEHTFGYNCDYCICDYLVNDTIKEIMIKPCVGLLDKDHYVEVDMEGFNV